MVGIEFCDFYLVECKGLIMLMEPGMSLLRCVDISVKFWTFCFMYCESLASGICVYIEGSET
jgi:hypothetical protein